MNKSTEDEKKKVLLEVLMIVGGTQQVCVGGKEVSEKAKSRILLAAVSQLAIECGYDYEALAKSVLKEDDENDIFYRSAAAFIGDCYQQVKEIFGSDEQK